MDSRLGLLAMIASMFLSSPVESITMKGMASSSIPVNTGIHSVSKSLKYLIASFPKIKTVAYTHLPDTVWRPLFVGTVANPEGVVADPLNERLFVADPDLKRIFWYQLVIEDDGLLKTDGHQHVAVDGVTASWLAVNGLGDLYFTGQMIDAPESSHRSIYRMDATKINVGNAMNPVEVYSRSNTIGTDGTPVPRVWKPSGIGVDSFNIYWGNEDKGLTNGALCSGARKNIDITGAAFEETKVINQAVNEVRGVALAGQSIFFVGPEGVYGVAMNSDGGQTNPNAGLMQQRGWSRTSEGWKPRDVAFDGENTVYWTETESGIIYEFPAANTNPQPLVKYVDAPLAYGLTVYGQTGAGRRNHEMEKDYGMLQSRAEAVESGAPIAVQLSLWAWLLSTFAALLAC